MQKFIRNGLFECQVLFKTAYLERGVGSFFKRKNGGGQFFQGKNEARTFFDSKNEG